MVSLKILKLLDTCHHLLTLGPKMEVLQI